MAQEDYTQIKIHKKLIREIDDLRTARMSRTEFINSFLANYLSSRYRDLKSRSPVDPGEIDIDIWADLFERVKERAREANV